MVTWTRKALAGKIASLPVSPDPDRDPDPEPTAPAPALPAPEPAWLTAAEVHQAWTEGLLPERFEPDPDTAVTR